MKIELPALHSEPLIYFLLHSGVFVLILGALFFILGLWFGALTWGKYKLQSKAAHEENQSLLGEIAVLKRKLAEQSLRPTSTATTPPKLLTEVLPNVSEVFPERQALYPALAAMPDPTISAPPIQEPVPIVPETDPVVVESAPELLAPPPIAAMPVSEPKTPAATAKPVVRAKAKLPAPEPALPTPAEPAIEVEPFGFLLAEPTLPEKVPQADPASALSSIIQGKPSTKPLRGAAKAGKTAKVKLPPVQTPVTVPAPEIDPALGPIYRSAPPNADDLTKIKGIASILEKRLHELGVHTYHQIAGWEESHIREFSNRLAFKDRIDREGWVNQARALEKARESV